MYLARQQHSSFFSYQLRQSYQTKDNCYNHRVLFNLGREPAQFFSIEENQAVIFQERLLMPLRQAMEQDPEPLLEKLLFEFFPTQVQQTLLTFKDRSCQYKGPLSREEKDAISRQVHIFDRRRLYYLRYGAVDQSHLNKLHEKCCRPLLGQSRDEREHYFIDAEKVLEPGLYFQYIFAIFNLHTYFEQSFAPWLPEALARVEVADQLTRVVCTLQKSQSFWQAETPADSLHLHLARYLWMFFDAPPNQASFQKDFADAFMGSHRTFSWPEKRVKANPQTIEALFGLSYAELSRLNKADLSRLYRKKAMHLHPDKGGDAEQFIILTEVYTTILGKN
ncbi:MAG: hypothetical protein COA36_09120 [Desulfotalea sp.]|nr:MAG: hypothetical protein COA36_09120 [Desulfotalea sp.]